mmetsp:Transcript_26905/g.101040  ORF Transcript_26905/g.101040 Transcript_26905/m.101040 type:complete len:212 (-) Transcript_26905:532-1167(-)
MRPRTSKARPRGSRNTTGQRATPERVARPALGTPALLAKRQQRRAPSQERWPVLLQRAPAPLNRERPSGLAGQRPRFALRGRSRPMGLTWASSLRRSRPPRRRTSPMPSRRRWQASLRPCCRTDWARRRRRLLLLRRRRLPLAERAVASSPGVKRRPPCPASRCPACKPARRASPGVPGPLPADAGPARVGPRPESRPAVRCRVSASLKAA